MAIFEELFGKVPSIISKTFGTSSKTTELFQLGMKEELSIERYYDLWRKKIKQASNQNRILSNGWAFSSLSGLSSFENYIRTNENFRSMYFNQAGEIKVTLDKVKEGLSWKKFGGVMLYGYGNLFRERYFIEQAILSKLISKNDRICLIDCSIYYHIFANSALNPLRPVVNPKKMKTLLVDYLEEPNSIEQLVYERNDIHGIFPVLHLFLGNTFGNSEAKLLKETLDKLVKPGDVIIGEYANYPKEYFSNEEDDYVSDMARMAASELYSSPVDNIETKNVSINGDCKYTEIKFKDTDSKESVCYKSMLRRNFNQSEFTSGEFGLMSTKQIIKNQVILDAYIRHSK